MVLAYLIQNLIGFIRKLFRILRRFNRLGGKPQINQTSTQEQHQAKDEFLHVVEHKLLGVETPLGLRLALGRPLLLGLALDRLTVGLVFAFLFSEHERTPRLVVSRSGIR